MGWCLEEHSLRVRETKDCARALKDGSDWENFTGVGRDKSEKEKKKGGTEWRMKRLIWPRRADDYCTFTMI